MTWADLLTWYAYGNIEPFGEERADLRAGIVASTIANCHRDPSKGKAFQAGDFMPRFEPDAAKGKRISGEDWAAYTAGLKSALRRKEPKG